MSDHDITPASAQTNYENTLHHVLEDAAKQATVITLRDNGDPIMRIEPVVLPREIGVLRPICDWDNFGNDKHEIPTQWVIRDIDTKMAYCQLRCAAQAALQRAREIQEEDARAQATDT